MKIISVLVILIGLGLIFAACSRTGAPKSEAPSSVDMHVTHMNARAAHDHLQANPDVTVIDVRTAAEFSAGHIAGAKNIDVKSSSFADNIAKLDPNQIYMVHCRSGARSTASLKHFKAAGYKNIIHMDGGFLDWQASDLPIIR